MPSEADFLGQFGLVSSSSYPTRPIRFEKSGSDFEAILRTLSEGMVAEDLGIKLRSLSFEEALLCVRAWGFLRSLVRHVHRARPGGSCRLSEKKEPVPFGIAAARSMRRVLAYLAKVTGSRVKIEIEIRREDPQTAYLRVTRMRDRIVPDFEAAKRYL